MGEFDWVGSGIFEFDLVRLDWMVIEGNEWESLKACHFSCDQISSVTRGDAANESD